MSKAVRNTLNVVFSLVLLNALTMAQPGGNNTNKNKNGGHHSRLAKIAFWRHHKEVDNNAKHAHVTQVPPKQAQSKTAQIKSASAKQSAGKKDEKQQHHANNMSKRSAKKGTTESKTTP